MLVINARKATIAIILCNKQLLRAQYCLVSLQLWRRGKSMEFAKNDAADVTADTLVDAGNIKLLIAPLDSALKIGLDRMLWCCLVVVSTRIATTTQRMFQRHGDGDGWKSF